MMNLPAVWRDGWRGEVGWLSTFAPYSHRPGSFDFGSFPDVTVTRECRCLPVDVDPQGHPRRRHFNLAEIKIKKTELFHTLEFVDRYSDLQIQVCEKVQFF